MKNKGLIGWILAAALAAALGGVLIFQAVDDDGGSRQAALRAAAQQGPPPEVAEDIERIRQEKDKFERGKVPDAAAAGKRPTVVGELRRDCDPNGFPNAHAIWRNQPQNLEEAAAAANQIVVGTAQGAQPGQSLVAAVPGEPGGQVETPVQNVTIRVDQAVRGRAREGAVVTIQRLGDAAGCFRVAGDPPFERGKKYLLLLEDGVGGRPPHAIGPTGRYEVGPDGALNALAENQIGNQVAGQRLEQVVERLRG